MATDLEIHELSESITQMEGVLKFLWTIDKAHIYLKDLPVDLPMKLDEAISMQEWTISELKRVFNLKEECDGHSKCN
ncbi:MAG: hypothetical protein KKD01_20200 [Proteobacteria bacterium]|nr:hypothetical protein [Pseudomonadota bacterium]